jgi:hypothetical protein
MLKDYVIIYADGHRYFTNAESFYEAVQNSELVHPGAEIQIAMTDSAYRKFVNAQDAVELACVNKIQLS